MDIKFTLFQIIIYPEPGTPRGEDASRNKRRQQLAVGRARSFNNCPLRYNIDDDVWLQLHLVLQSLIVCSSCKYLIVGCKLQNNLALNIDTAW